MRRSGRGLHSAWAAQKQDLLLELVTGAAAGKRGSSNGRALSLAQAKALNSLICPHPPVARSASCGAVSLQPARNSDESVRQ